MTKLKCSVKRTCTHGSPGPDVDVDRLICDYGGILQGMVVDDSYYAVHLLGRREAGWESGGRNEEEKGWEEGWRRIISIRKIYSKT